MLSASFVLICFVLFFENKEIGICDVDYGDGFFVRIYDRVLWYLGLGWRVVGFVEFGAWDDRCSIFNSFKMFKHLCPFEIIVITVAMF